MNAPEFVSLIDLSLQDLREYRSDLCASMRAYQSTDDLGSPQANDAAYNQALRVQSRLHEAEAEISRRTANTQNT